MSRVLRTAGDMIGNMTPVLVAGEAVFVTTADDALAARCAPFALATCREEEGMSLIVPIEVARDAGFDTAQPMRCITLHVYSALDGVGLTGAVATALADHNIPCNMVAAFHHDHVYVPTDMAARALEVLVELQRRAAGSKAD